MDIPILKRHLDDLFQKALCRSSVDDVALSRVFTDHLTFSPSPAGAVPSITTMKPIYSGNQNQIVTTPSAGISCIYMI